MMPLCYLEGYQNIISNNKENKEKELPKVMFLQFDEIMRIMLFLNGLVTIKSKVLKFF